MLCFKKAIHVFLFFSTKEVCVFPILIPFCLRLYGVSKCYKYMLCRGWLPNNGSKLHDLPFQKSILYSKIHYMPIIVVFILFCYYDMRDHSDITFWYYMMPNLVFWLDYIIQTIKHLHKSVNRLAKLILIARQWAIKYWYDTCSTDQSTRLGTS